MITKTEIRKMLPYGSLTDVAKKAGVSKTAVTNFFNNTTKSSRKIEKAALECALEYQKENSAIVNELKSVTE
jgi:DNA-binding LacI/PurR family transcriptional regulator